MLSLAMVSQGRNVRAEPTLGVVFPPKPALVYPFLFFFSLRNFVLKSFRGRHGLASAVGPHVIFEGANHVYQCVHRMGTFAATCCPPCATISGREMPDNFARHTRLGPNLKCGLDKLQRADACCIRRLRYRGACTGCDNK